VSTQENGRDCQDCGVQPGRPHTGGCDTARCLATGYQRLSCSRAHEAGDLDCGQDIWIGTWPGGDDAIRLGWYAQWTETGGWRSCAPDDPGAMPDLNRLNGFNGEARWDRETRRWEALK
jgi:hypothetical protein